MDWTQALKAEAARIGFPIVGVAPAVAPPGLGHLHDWLDAGYHGELNYLAERRPAYEHPRHVLDGVRSLLVLGVPYRTVEPAPIVAGTGRTSRYAWGLDYHDLIRERLHALADYGRTLAPSAQFRGVVDTAPLLEGEFAKLAGIGWQGKNTLLLHRTWGSWFFLAVLLTDLELIPDAPFETDHCGTCRACLDACPTGAFIAPYVLDARRCISYLTIELREPIPVELRAGLGDWVFGCDICQDVCPWNQKGPEVDEPALLPREGLNPLGLIELFTLDDEQYRRLFRRTPLWRAKRRGLLRNAALVLGNQRDPRAKPALHHGLVDDEPWVRGASAWGLAQIGLDPRDRERFSERLCEETDPVVRDELRAALER